MREIKLSLFGGSFLLDFNLKNFIKRAIKKCLTKNLKKMKKLLLFLFLPLMFVACGNVQPESNQDDDRIKFFSDRSQKFVMLHPDSITNVLARCVEFSSPYVKADEENARYCISFFPMNDSISRMSFFFDANLDGTDITLTDCLLTLHGQYDFVSFDVEELLHCTSFIIYPILDGYLMEKYPMN